MWWGSWFRWCPCAGLSAASCFSLPFLLLFLKEGGGPLCAQLPSSLATIIPLLLAPTEPHSTALAVATYPQAGTGSPDCEPSLHLD